MKRIQYLLERIYRGFNIRAYIFDTSGTLLYRSDKGKSIRAITDDQNLVEDYGEKVRPTEALLTELRHLFNKIKIPVFLMDKSGIYHLSFGAEDLFYVLGPACIDNISFDSSAKYRRAHNIKDVSFSLPVLSLTEAFNILAITYERVTGIELTDGEIFRANDTTIKTADSDVVHYEYIRELDQKHRLSYAVEQKWISDIENGVFDSSKIDFSPENMDLMSQIGTLAYDSYKQVEYMVLTSLTLASRAAMRGGVSTYEAYMLSDLYFQKISKAQNVIELLHIHVEIAKDYSDRVKKAKQTRLEDYIEKAVDYIARHRTHKIAVPEMAKEIGVSVGYLSRRFSSEMGMTLQEYILKQRLMAGANMLVYSDLTIGEIAEYLSFSSQSYFGDCFREEYDLTPQQYRKLHKVIDFDKKS